MVCSPGLDGKGKPHGCLEPTKAVTKGKPHVFENQSDNPKLNRSILTYAFFLDLVLVNPSWSIELASSERKEPLFVMKVPLLAVVPHVNYDTIYIIMLSII